jgi:predicted AAA+ superfamily ATPase
METIPRLIRIELPEGQSAFLWGPRKTGKTTYLKSLFPDSITYNMLETDLFLELIKRPYLLREQLLKDLNLLRVLNRGMIPQHYLQEEYQKSLHAYVRD